MDDAAGADWSDDLGDTSILASRLTLSTAALDLLRALLDIPSTAARRIRADSRLRPGGEQAGPTADYRHQNDDGFVS